MNFFFFFFLTQNIETSSDVGEEQLKITALIILQKKKILKECNMKRKSKFLMTLHTKFFFFWRGGRKIFYFKTKLLCVFDNNLQGTISITGMHKRVV